MKKYITLSYKDNALGRRRMAQEIENLSKQGWEIKGKDIVNQGYSMGKTIALGAIFLPLALLGRKGNRIEVVMEKEVTEEDLQKEKAQDEFMSGGKKIIPIQPDGSVVCPECGTNIKNYTLQGLFSKTRVYNSPNCNHTVLK